ncbi:unnamed protein product [Phytophthora fragariaefolia]|uniref:Unnamed protein product n=1 Tax=Phytophthora fragariaefolia TaxID=1490495 RepID=A0A9W7DEG8_9STRA|nr:unnamed protein product [Phytophthora fragariaefolia]
MSVQTLATSCAAKITPASATFEAAVVESPSILPATKAALDPIEKQPDSDAAVADVVDANNTNENAQHPEAAHTPDAAPSESELARNNWLELRARVESVDPRVFAFRDDPKYLQQCAEAKQRRTAAAASPITPAWH